MLAAFSNLYVSKSAIAPQATCAAASAATGRPLEKGMSLSGWLQGVRSDPLLDYRSAAELPASAGVIIIGSGITGVTTAYELLNSADPPKSIVLLEAREFCSGATGRNAGHCKPDQYRGFSSYQKKFGTEQAMKVAMTSRACALELDVATTDELAALGAKNWEAFKAAGGKTDHIEYITDPEEAVKRSRVRSAKAVWSWDASTLYPWKFAAHIARICLQRGLHLQTWIPVLSVTPTNGGAWSVETERGSIIAPTIVHATNAYAGALLPDMAHMVTPTPHMCNRVIPPRAWSGGNALQNSYGVLVPGGALYSINPTQGGQGIVLFGGSNPAQHKLHEYVDAHPGSRTDDGLANFAPVTQAVEDFIKSDFEGWDTDYAPGEGPDYAWSGIIGMSADGVPFVGAVPGRPGQWICAGHSGHGMARCFTFAPGLVRLLQGGTWADTSLPDVYELTPERVEALRPKKKSTGIDAWGSI
ncbi:DAO-domain-containing protein [Fistulina hepatica ATCC 64428]|uniref:DAO-domain-containing protein n=1 Tax=Fistulina hepatica ATCC 64428 TaxID=1128425 RepID=A0A0D7ALH0_9AGAR|nr:DAO-domain-containing protein [Fistulina hepatica ATCC 64428]